MTSDLAKAFSSYVAAHGGPDALSVTPVENLFLMCSTKTRLPFRKMYRPSLCIVAQGAKRIEVAETVLDYPAGTALAISVELPGYGGVTQASSEAPFLGMTIEFDMNMIRAVLDKLPAPPPATPDGSGLFVERLSDAQQDCIARLVRLLGMPEAVPVLYPAIMQELYYWLLVGPNGGEIAKMVRSESHTQRIADAIFHLRRVFRRSVRIEELADVACMSPSSFHQHFKTLTSMTPLQYQKQLRLIEARRLMVMEAANVTRAAFEVGYESPSQFSREYSRLFGSPPKQDAMTLRPHRTQLGL
ncbi:AraC family transcriptional regulator [Paroceanicella profunda]|uniref:AraC family transcriptional regulator n=1 Tax=Paroceanicella profunda TaxID=2579971 RepID=A0A5B8G1U9_9RHOB|nr:AraC family transcriptional regulator [Paroceanicella profunda]QDL93229.1 AraC family transcriptional regulator [Paroceanicella profunda]